MHGVEDPPSADVNPLSPPVGVDDEFPQATAVTRMVQTLARGLTHP
jgi:hypothetical protein